MTIAKFVSFDVITVLCHETGTDSFTFGNQALMSTPQKISKSIHVTAFFSQNAGDKQFNDRLTAGLSGEPMPTSLVAAPWSKNRADSSNWKSSDCNRTELKETQKSAKTSEADRSTDHLLSASSSSLASPYDSNSSLRSTDSASGGDSGKGRIRSVNLESAFASASSYNFESDRDHCRSRTTGGPTNGIRPPRHLPPAVPTFSLPPLPSSKSASTKMDSTSVDASQGGAIRVKIRVRSTVSLTASMGDVVETKWSLRSILIYPCRQ